MTDLADTTSKKPNSERGPLYVLSGVERTYSKGGLSVRALKTLDLEIAEGDLVCLEGPSGSGKSTLLLLLGALDVPTAGSVRFADQNLTDASDDVLTGIRSTEIGFVFQQFNLVPTLTAAENVALTLVPNVSSRADRHDRASELLNQVGLGERLDHLPSRLSGGEQQRVAIARALANSPRVIIADEPTGNLDSASAKEVMSVLTKLNAEDGVTIIIATHDEAVASGAHRRIRMLDGAPISN